ncbi:MAG: membrane protein insertion efficiency factor YidD [Pseudonocardia sp.]|nr:membrane protein insertion efficiency factor YidD [Pseudonocardia sp.]
MNLSALLHAAAAILPRRNGTGVVVALIRAYQRLLSRFTASCPRTPSCSAYALDAVRTLGPRHGTREAAARIRACGRRHP